MADVKCGYMHKCGKSVKSWKRRWFVLKPNGYLYYYESKGSNQEKGKIDVVDASKIGVWKEVAGVERKLPSGFSCDNAFGIIVKDRTFTCVCENDGDSLAWLEAFKKVGESGGNSSYPEPSYPKEKEEESQAPPVEVKKEVPLTSRPPPPYSSVDQYSQSLPRSASVHVPATDPGPNFSTLPRPRSDTSQGNPVMAPPLPPTNPYYTPEVARTAQAAASAQAPPPSNPNYRPPAPQQQAQPQYQPQPHYRPAPPQPQYRPAPPQPQYRPAPPQPQYRPAQPQYRPPPAQPQYRPPPQPQYHPQGQPQYYHAAPQPLYRQPPPQPQYQYRPPAQPQYRPAAPYQPPVRQSKYMPPGPRQQYKQPAQYQPPQQAGQMNKTTVTVITTTVRK